MVSRSERAWAALAHALLVLPVVGVLGTLALYVAARDARPFAAGHARQALAFQVAVQALQALLAVAAAVVLAVAGALGGSKEKALVACAGAALGLTAGTLVAAAAAASAAVRGRPYRYPLVGRWVKAVERA